MKISATQFKATCLELLDRVQASGESISITKRGRVVAKLVAEHDVDERPWLALRGQARWHGDPLAPVVDEADIEAYK